MRTFGLGMLIALGWMGCTTSMPEDQFRTLTDEHHYRLMEGENAMMGSYLTWREFHAGLKWECRKPELEPYPEMFALIDSMKVFHDEALSNRGKYYQCREDQLKGYASLDKKSQGQRIAIEQVCYSQAEEKLAGYNRAYWKLEAVYDSIRTVHGIQRITHGEYADSLMRRMLMWEDSLVHQGRLIGAGRSTMKSIQLPPADPSVQAVYKPLSQMEKLHKEFQAQLLLVENQHGRYDRSRLDEVYYTGPHLVIRYDVDKTEAEISKLPGMMEQFNALHGLFRTALTDQGFD